MTGVRVHITGIVQGVGMRPHVYRKALEHGIGGWVRNAGDGVHVLAVAQTPEQLRLFLDDLVATAPAAASIDGVDIDEGPCPVPARMPPFEIVASDADSERSTLVSPDIATCPDCLRELFDPANRRYHYPFINCTNCGPRFTIIRSLPYDRASTSMSGFPMCEACSREYADPLDRRFHAQPDACFECGPHVTWREPGSPIEIGSDRAASDAIIERCAEALGQGRIVAIKGLGGFHLACDARNEGAVGELRRRKRRSRKPLAVMVRDVGCAECLCDAGERERSLLTGSVRPIVLLRRAPRGGAGSGDVARSVAFDLPELGIMLPYTPLQHLLLDRCRGLGMDALVMTSGNLSGSPIETDDDAAWESLVEGGVADALLGNDRPILSRFDDSVVRVAARGPMPVRRSRGYAPRPLEIPLPDKAADAPAGPDAAGTMPVVCACGAEQKATVAIARGLPGADGGSAGSVQCLLSQHIGDLENGEVLDAWHEARTRLADLFGLEPDVLACDLHPGYLSSRWARDEAARTGKRLVEVQHHHAHIASVIAECAARGEVDSGGRVVGIALDGTGAGTDGAIWGGEILVATLDRFRRAGRLRPWRLPGGAAAIADPRRCAYGLLSELGLVDHPGAHPLLASLGEDAVRTLDAMLASNINSPATSSAGRLFDAAAALLGVCERATYEGEPAVELEAAACRAGAAEESASLPNALIARARPEDAAAGHATDRARAGELEPGALLEIDMRPIVEGLLDAVSARRPACDVALAFHRAVARAISGAAAATAERLGIGAVALSGGVFMNGIMLEEVSSGLEGRGLRVLAPREVPVNDGCIAYGQAAVACSRVR